MPILRRVQDILVHISAAAVILAVLLVASSGQAQVDEPAADIRGDVPLRSGTLRLPPGIAPGVAALRTQSVPSDREPPRLILDFESLPDAELRDRLMSLGIRLGDFLGGSAYVATIEEQGVATLQAAADNLIQLPGLRAAAPILPAYKQEENVRRRTIGSWAVREDGSVLLRVEVWSDADYDAMTVAVGNLAQEIVQRAPDFDHMTVRIRPERIDELAGLNGVSWLEQAPPPIEKLNDQSGSQLRVDQVQIAPYNLTGQGVIIGVWDGGAVAPHPDFQGRLTIIDTVAADAHATHVAGTAAGSGVRSQPEGGAANQWRGMATQAQILSWDYLGNLPNEYLDGIQNRRIALANNSWSRTISTALGNCDRYGLYEGESRDFDRIVHGDIGNRAIPVVFAAGNERNDGDCGMTGGPFPFYRVIPTPNGAKNVITVGAINSNDLAMTAFSSWGPVKDGRLKPEVVAPGCQSNGDGGINSTNLSNGYRTDCGTSMAAPAVAGTVALLLQQYRVIYGRDMPVPATAKALLVHTARDLGRPGPDYTFGYGLVDAQSAADAIRTMQIFDGVLEPGRVTSFRFKVRDGTPEIKVTLAWDDQAAAAMADPTLVNDLDLIILGPASQVHRPFILDAAIPSNDAGRGEDRINVVEQALITNPQPGIWYAQVSGRKLSRGSQRYALVAPRDAPHHRVVGRFNADNLPDVYLHWRDDGANLLYINQGGNSFREIINPIGMRSVNHIDNLGVDHVAVGDFSGENRADIYFHWPQGFNRLYINRGDGIAFTEIVNPIETGSVNPINGGAVNHMLVTDFNNANGVDIYFTWPDGTNRLYLNKGTGKRFDEVLNPIPPSAAAGILGITTESPLLE